MLHITTSTNLSPRTHLGKAKFGAISGVFGMVKNYFVITRNLYPWLWGVTGIWVQKYGIAKW